MKSLIVCYSYHHHNTEQIAKVFAESLNAQVLRPQQVDPQEIAQYDLVGFGAGIDSGKHYKVLLDFAEKLPRVDNKKAFIFSTAGITGDKKQKKDHLALNQKLAGRGYVIVAEFQCRGFNTNSFLKVFGGMNKGRPNAEDLKNAQDFALKLNSGKV
jgi:flavodoxin